MRLSPDRIEPGAARNVALYPWFKFCQSLVFWQAVWFLYFQQELSAAEAVLLYAIYDIGTTALEVPSGYLSDRFGRRFTLIASAVAGCAAMALLAMGGGFAVFALAQVLLGASMAFASGTDSAILFESLAATGQADDIEHHEIRAWRFSFGALAISAVLGGVMALTDFALPFAGGAVAFAAVLAITLAFREPPRSGDTPAEGAELARLASLRSALTEPALVWLFVLSVLMYGYSHIPFVFGQPFILEALRETGFAAETPLVSGLVTSTMMIVSVGASLFATSLRHRLGLPGLLLIAFATQIALAGVLALTTEAIAIAFLFLRMVPDSLSRPFILATIQPMLDDDSRATYLSLKSFCGRLIFAASLFLASRTASDEGAMTHAEISTVLGWYVLAGVLCLAALALAALRVRIGRTRPRGP